MLSSTETTSKELPLGLSLNHFLGNIISGNMNLYPGFTSGYPGMLGIGQNPSFGSRHQTVKLQEQVASPNNSRELRDPSLSSQISLTSGFISGYPGMLGLDNLKIAQFQNQIKASGTNTKGQLPYGTETGGYLSNGYSSSNFGTDSSFKPGFFEQIDSVNKGHISGQSEFGNTANRPGPMPYDFKTDTFGQIGFNVKGRTSPPMGDHSEFGNSVADRPGSEHNGEVNLFINSANWNGEWPGT
ncbi:hypothetical protein CHS0354_017555 [Potamilus streckersoni]|uniref:Uncharacterized protein n=1 Tax=Potamilus streckersoni TaxID=2493646 RepID=A0AAE0TGA8_9BIVA|nr:hypothetical protein CHS0354_017555 [Potamilus streckersoni]